MGGLSSLFDLATFAILLGVFHAGMAEFRTAWFAESMLTQVLVIFVIRTYGSAWVSRPHPALVASSLAGLAVAMVVVTTPLGAALGFVMVPWPIALALAVIVVLYLASAELVKRFASPPIHRRRWR